MRNEEHNIDIIIPYWGDFVLLKSAVNSVINQTSKNWRLTIIDDCYPSLQARDYFMNFKHPKIKYIRHKKNLGISQNFNYAVESAKEKYCTILGYDDLLLPDYVEKALINLKKVDFYHPGVEIINVDGQKINTVVDSVKKILRPKNQGVYSGKKLAESICKANWLYFPAIAWRTDIIKKYKFNNNYMIVMDLDLEMNIIQNEAKLYLDNKITFKYRRFSGSVSSREKGRDGVRFDEEKHIYKKIAKEMKSKGWKKAYLLASLNIFNNINRLINFFYH